MNERDDKQMQIKAMAKFFAKINSAEEFEELFSDLCTYKETEQMALRLNCAYLLKNGETYNGVMEKVAVSSATLSRVSRCVSHGSGGYNTLIEKYGYKPEEDAFNR